MIDPMVFYWVGLVEKLEWVSFGIFFMSLICSALAIVSLLLGNYDESTQKAFKRWILSGLFCSVVSLFVFTAIPPRPMLYMMVAAKYVTVDNINEAGTVISNNVEKIVKAMNVGRGKNS